MIDHKDSQHTAITVNIAKLALLAALAPPVIAGIAQRASMLDEGIDVAALVAYTVSLGSISAIIGALSFGALADVGSASKFARWCWVAVGTGIGTLGLTVLALSATKAGLITGWVLAQLGYSGAMAVLRVILAMTLPSHRRRGAVVVVLGSYGGLFIPVIILLLFPQAIWSTTFGLALVSLAIPVVCVLTLVRHRSPVSHIATAQHVDPAPHPGDAPAPHQAPAPHREESSSAAPLSKVWLLVIQSAANAVVTVFLSYHPLELAARATDEAVFPVRASVLVIAAALAGLVSATTVLLRYPNLLARSVRVVAVAGILLAASLVMRAFADSLGGVIFAAVMSGIGVGLNSSALFATALDMARERSGGKLMGAYSAAGALGQFVGPMMALGFLGGMSATALLPSDEAGYRTLFVFLALVPLSWAAAAAVFDRRWVPTTSAVMTNRLRG